MAGRKPILLVVMLLWGTRSCGSFSQSDLPQLVGPNTHKMLQKMVQLAPPWPGPEGPRALEQEDDSEYDPGKPAESIEALELREASKKKLLETIILMTRLPEVVTLLLPCFIVRLMKLQDNPAVRSLQESLNESKHLLQELVYDEDLWWESMVHKFARDGRKEGSALNDMDEIRILSYNGAIFPKFYWSQDVFQCDLYVKVSNDTRARDVRVKLQKKNLHVQIKGETLIDEELAFHVRDRDEDTEGCWELRTFRHLKLLQIHLLKSTEGIIFNCSSDPILWDRVFLADKSIETAAIDQNVLALSDLRSKKRLCGDAPSVPHEDCCSLSSLRLQIQPSDLLKIHSIDLLFSYVCSVRLFRGRTLAFADSSSSWLVALSAVLTARDSEGCSAINSTDYVLAKSRSALMSKLHFLDQEDREGLYLQAIGDVETIAVSKTLTLSAFNEMKKIFETSLQRLAPEEHETKQTKGKVDAFALRANASIFIPRDHLLAAMHKMRFFTAWRGDQNGSLLIHQRILGASKEKRIWVLLGLKELRDFNFSSSREVDFSSSSNAEETFDPVSFLKSRKEMMDALSESDDLAPADMQGEGAERSAGEGGRGEGEEGGGKIDERFVDGKDHYRIDEEVTELIKKGKYNPEDLQTAPAFREPRVPVPRKMTMEELIEHYNKQQPEEEEESVDQWTNDVTDAKAKPAPARKPKKPIKFIGPDGNLYLMREKPQGQVQEMPSSVEEDEEEIDVEDGW
ncbi:hypothetical protein GUITHDRAFT_146176 [Guillardia theta CCMP2712]|uniref:CS domain-containing protein n=2 Tax=Guillardia theta TaxID=55529 RepID=L1IIT7_GUITC|nr:hypothetical protein GUITHDRAFT_146176 [Guillardia theta CCMP2712]EKX35819.1 hypothetical protein GUITHDRAFT_146176 [Guillardia theta CCMP2712]|eukprot:XP_005822799.1 hypothetical protein GUITHDRAFT_146176 [Guillardia theta CCMP2712]